MALSLRELFGDRPFLAGLLLRLLAVLFFVPQIQADWFVPFMASTLQPPTADPWTAFLRGGGDSLAFPYGPVMYLVHAPTVLLGALLDRAIGSAPTLTRVGFGLSLLLADLALLVGLLKLTGAATRRIVLLYWWSPIVLLVTYWHGQTDVVPTLLIVLALLAMKRLQLDLSAVFLGLAAASKLSALIALPFMVLFVWNTPNLRARCTRFLLLALGTVSILQGPFLLLPGAQTMIVNSPEIAKIYEISVTLSNGTQIYLVPLLYLLLLFAAQQIGRINFALLYCLLGLSFLLIVLCTPASIGWYLWIVPFLCVWQLEATRTETLLVWLFSACFVALKLAVGTGAAIPVLQIDLRAPLIELFPGLITPSLVSKAITVLTALGLALSVRILARGLLANDFYRLSRQPLAIGIAGDSGTGKDTLGNALAALFGQDSVTSISGDDYHIFERQGAMWRTLTHLDPRANDLRRFTLDTLALRAGKAILARHYDHATGRFTRKRRVAANEVVLVTGLHALYPQALNEQLDVKVFLDMHEGLRRHYKLRRDVMQRGHALATVMASIERRMGDFERYVAPQAERADICLSLIPAEPDFVPDPARNEAVPLRLRVRLKHSLHVDDLARFLVAHCGAGVDVGPAAPDGTIDLLIEGEQVTSDDLGFVGRMLVPHLEELNPMGASWQPGLTGVMQLCVMVQLADNVARSSANVMRR